MLENRAGRVVVALVETRWRQQSLSVYSSLAPALPSSAANASPHRPPQLATGADARTLGLLLAVPCLETDFCRAKDLSARAAYRPAAVGVALPDLVAAGLLVVLADGPGVPELWRLVPVRGIGAAGTPARSVRLPAMPSNPVELLRLVEPLAVLANGPGVPERSHLVPMLRRPALALSTLASTARRATRWRVSLAGPLKNRAGRMPSNKAGRGLLKQRPALTST